MTDEALAALVADGSPVDWDEALRSASDDRERRVIRHLRLVESVARVHRSGGSSPGVVTMTETTGGQGEARKAFAKETWSHLELREKLGEGAFGEVYRAWDPRLDREVALKLVGASRFQAVVIEEGRVLAKLRHPNVVTVHGAEVHGGRVGIWMELIRGRSLAQLIRDQGPFGAREAALAGIDLCRALAAVHRAGIVHRDVKAQNAMREEGGRIVLMDFGAGIELAALRDARGSVSGTPYYMAPELFEGAPATVQSDLYGLGVLLYHLVTGSFPVEAGSWTALRDKHARRQAKLLRDVRSDLPEAFLQVVERALSWNPADRFATAGQMEQALASSLGVDSARGAALEGTVPGRRKRLILGVASLAAVAAIAGALLVAWVRDRAASPPPAPATSEAVPGPYSVEAALYRVPPGSQRRERLEPGAQLTLGDHLTLEFRASAPLFVYVLDEDEAGHAYALFPLPGLEVENPLPGGAAHVLPGARDGKSLSWTVDSVGGREHLMVLASPKRLVEFEAEMNSLARPGESAVPISEVAKIRLRGMGGLAEGPPASPGTTAPATHLFEMAERLAGRSEVVQGIWMRRIDLENPRPR